MKQVFLCIPTLASAGAERFVTELACNIDQKRYIPTVLITKHLDPESAFYHKLKEKKIRVINVGDCPYIKTIKKTISLLKNEKPEIIHTNVGAALHMLPPQLLSLTKARHLFTIHSMGYRIFRGIKKGIIYICFKTRSIIPVAICDTVKKSIEETYRLPATEIECVYNGVDTTLFKKTTETQGRPFTFVSVGTLYHIKNHELLIDAFRIVFEKYNCARLVIVGDGELREVLEAKVEGYGLKSNIQFVGNQTDVVKYLSDSDVYCCTSKVEGLPIAVLEAMACSLPIITTPAGGVVDIINDGVNGFIVEADASIYAQRMIELIYNDKQRESMSCESRILSLKYSLDKCVKGYENLYKKYGI